MRQHQASRLFVNKMSCIVEIPGQKCTTRLTDAPKAISFFQAENSHEFLKNCHVMSTGRRVIVARFR